LWRTEINVFLRRCRDGDSRKESLRRVGLGHISRPDSTVERQSFWQTPASVRLSRSLSSSRPPRTPSEAHATCSTPRTVRQSRYLRSRHGSQRAQFSRVATGLTDGRLHSVRAVNGRLIFSVRARLDVHEPRWEPPHRSTIRRKHPSPVVRLIIPPLSGDYFTGDLWTLQAPVRQSNESTSVARDG